MSAIFDRIARHWFLFVFVFGLYCAMIAGIVGKLYGVPSLFRDDPALELEPQIALFSNGPIFLSQVAASILIGMIWLVVSLLDHTPSRQYIIQSAKNHILFLAPRLIGFSIIPLVACYYSLATDGTETTPFEIGRALLGTLTGCFFVLLNLAIAHLVARLLKAQIIYIVLILLVLFWAILSVIPGIIPAVSIAIVLGWFILLYTLICLIAENVRPIAVVAIVLAILLGNGILFKYTFEGLKDPDGKSYYAADNQVDLYREEQSNKQLESEPAPANNQTSQKSIFKTRAFKKGPTAKKRLRSFEPLPGALVGPIRSLQAWKEHLGQDKPKLVVVATSGGAYRASFWTALILDRLEEDSKQGRQLQGFTKNIKLLTGASGGMIASAYFAASRDEGGKAPHVKSIVSLLESDIRQANKNDRFGSRYPVPRDSLSIVTQQLVQRDVLHLFWPFQIPLDRGKVLENQWKSLDITFEDLKEGQREGWRPSIIFSPMIVETGQPLMISNLNLRAIRQEVPERTLLYRRFKIPEQQSTIKSREQKLKETVEFFKLFRGASQTFKLKTAARMSASFAYISPAVELPTNPARRVVDAGYYDNYGISVAIAYLKQRNIRRWIQENTSGVMIVQIRAYPSVVEEEGEAQEMIRPATRDFIDETVKCEDINLPQLLAKQPGYWQRAFHFLTSPIEGQETARQASMLFRNNQEIRLLQSLYPEGFIDTVNFENASAISLNWYLPDNELICLKRQLNKQHNVEAFEELAEFWNKK